MKKRLRLSLSAVFAVILCSGLAQAELLTYSSGTGFFINQSGYVLTNNHVINHCSHITLSGPLPLAEALLVARDQDNDLALLKTSAHANDIARLSSAKQPLRAGDPVVIVGYPGQSWQTGDAITRTATILNLKGPSGEEKWLQFSDALAAGNSGGPLLDAADNVVGIVAAKGHLVMHDTATHSTETVANFDLAISLPMVRQFLDTQGIAYQEADSGIYFSPDHVTEMARGFVVNVRCKYEDK